MSPIDNHVEKCTMGCLKYTQNRLFYILKNVQFFNKFED